MDLSIIIPSIRVENWEKIYQSIQDNIGQHTFEAIFVGPNVNLPEALAQYKNIKVIRDFGCPSRAMQIGSLFAEGKYLSWVCDDGVFVDSVIGEIIRQLETENNEKLVCGWIYTEGDHYKRGRDMRITAPQNWYRSKFHDDFKSMYGVKDSWFSVILFTMRTSYYHSLGGLNCKFETINYNLHDLSYRIQRDNGILTYSKEVVFRLSWQEAGVNRTVESCPVLNATINNDRPLLKEMYGEEKELPINIDLNNWRESETIWKRKWNK